MKIKTPEKRGLNFIFKWSSHQPVVKALYELISPELIIELGVGRYSTPMFLNFNAEKILHIDNEKGWLDLVKKENSENIKANSEFRLHDLSSLNIDSLKILPGQLTEYQKDSIDKYYDSLASEIKKFNFKSSLIFTDGFASCRKSSVDILTKYTDVMIFHDAEKPEAYGYNSLNKELYNTHDEYLFKTLTSWTGILIRKGLVTFEDLNLSLVSKIDEYVHDIGIPNEGFELIQMHSS